MEPKITKGSEVEVCSEEDGFRDAWFRAVLVDNPTKSGRKKLRVRFLTLLNDDCSSHLIEITEPRFIRPVPPEILYDGVVFDEGLVVDADHRDGWWTGFVINKLKNDKFLVYFDSPPDLIQFHRKQLRPHLDWIASKWVRPDIKELSKSLFSCGTMVEVSCKIDNLEAIWVHALVVKEIQEGGEDKFIVKCFNNKSFSCDADEVYPNITVDKCDVRPVPPPFFVESYDLLDRVEAFDGFGWHQGLVRGLLADKHYSVSLVAKKEESVVAYSDLRLSKEWEDGVWHQGPKRKPEKETPSNGKRKIPVALESTLSEISAFCRPKKLKIIRCCTATKTTTPASLSSGGKAARTAKRTTKHSKTPMNPSENIETTVEGKTERHETVATMELPLAQESGNQLADDVRNGDATQVITPQVIPIEMESAPPVTPVLNATLVEETYAETQSPEKTLQSMKMQNGLGINATGDKMSEKHNGEDSSCKRKRELKHDSNLIDTGEACNGSKAQVTDIRNDDDQPLSAWISGRKSSTGSGILRLSNDHTTNVVKVSAAGTRANEDTAMVLPFAKRSPIWKEIESMEVFKTVKQSPHFSPLLETGEEFREGLAVGLMVNFSRLLERVKDLKLDVSKSTLERLKVCFSELEKHGFDVTPPISRIDMLLSLKDKHVNKVEELRDEETEITEESIKRQKAEDDLRDVERKILKLQSQKADLNEKKDASGKEIVRKNVRASAIVTEIQDVELEFQSIVSTPW